MDRDEAMELFEERFGELLTPELFGRLLVYFESMGVIKHRADAAAITDPEQGLRSRTF